jgi:hypothetical protein
MTTRTTRPTRNRAILVPRACASFRHAEKVLGSPVGSRRRCCRYSRSNSQGITTTTQLLPLRSRLRVAHNRSRFWDGLTSSGFSEHGGSALTVTGREGLATIDRVCRETGGGFSQSQHGRGAGIVRGCDAGAPQRLWSASRHCNPPRDDAQRDGPALANGTGRTLWRPPDPVIAVLPPTDRAATPPLPRA